jgi:hypothetical protein
VDNNDLDLGMSKSGFIHTLPSGRLSDGDDISIIQVYVVIYASDRDENTSRTRKHGICE